ncbi:MAG: hypothetical protein IPM02_10415 [Betaproteobacteria bacterium]|nr:hypothetical protein [Betaproteobacteria bacterium]
MRHVLIWLLLLTTAASASVPEAADPSSDAPEQRATPATAYKNAPTYQQALQAWRTPEDLNAWIGARFEYDMPRAMLLSETQRSKSGSLPIHRPGDFFAAPAGVCVDLARFGVETLRAIDPAARASYLMIEFAPVTIGGNTLRLHWLASFQRDGKHYFFADSKRPGHLSGPHASTQEFIDGYAKYRGRTIVRFRELESYERPRRTPATKQVRDERQ